MKKRRKRLSYERNPPTKVRRTRWVASAPRVRARRNYYATGRSGATLGSERELARLEERRQKLAQEAAALGMTLAEYVAHRKKVRAAKYRAARRAKLLAAARERAAKKAKQIRKTKKTKARAKAEIGGTVATKTKKKKAKVKKAKKAKSRKTRKVKTKANLVRRSRPRRRGRRNPPVRLSASRPVRRVKVGRGRGRAPVRYKLKRVVGKKHAYAKLVRQNPDFKGIVTQGGMLYAGVLGMRVLGNLIDKHVVQKYLVKPDQSVTTGKLLSVAPAAIGFGLAAFADKFIKGKPALVTGLQMGATIALFDAIVQKFVKPALATSAPDAAALLGFDDYRGYSGRAGWGYHEYIPAPVQPLGIDVHEAMALDEYIQTPVGLGYDVSEALADTEVDAFQRGYASGSLAKTAFSV